MLRGGVGLSLGLATVRERWTAFAGSFAALFLGAILVSATSTALLSAGPRLPDRLAGAQVLVTVPAVERPEGNFSPDRPWSPEQVVALQDRLAAIPGVERAVPDRSLYAQPVVDGVPVEDHRGHAWSSAALAPYRLVSGTEPRQAGQVALDRSLGRKPGTRVTVLTARGPAEYTVSGTVDGPGVYLSDGEAARLAGGVRLIGLLLAPGTDVAAVDSAARTAIGHDGRVFSGRARVAAEPLEDARIRWVGMQALTAMSILAASSAVFVTASAFAFGVAWRRQEFGLLRAVGATPRQVRASVYGEALAVGVVASAAGTALGAVLAPVLGDLLVALGFQPSGFTVRVRAWSLAGCFLVGIAVALLGAWSASRRAGRVSPLEALREAAADERPIPLSRKIAGGLLCVLGLAGAAVTATAGGNELVSFGLFTAAALICGLALLAPLIAPPVVRLATWPLGRLRGATGMIVRESALASVRRTASTAAPVLITVGFAVLVTGMTATTAASFDAARASVIRAESVVLPDGVAGLSDAAAGVGGAWSTLPTALYRVNGEAVPALGAERDHLLAAGLKPSQGSLEDFGGNNIVVKPWVAQQGWGLGQVVPVGFEDGCTVSLKVAAVVDDLPNSVLVPRDLVRAHDPSALAEEAFILGKAPDAVPGGLGTRIVAAEDYARVMSDEDDRLTWIFTVLLVAVSAGYTGVAIATTLMTAAAGRARDLVVLRLSGATAGQALRTVAVESVLVVVLGTLLGLAVAIPTLLGMRAGLAEQLSAPVPLVLPVPLILVVIGFCLLLAAGAAVFTARRAVRSQTDRSGD
ncbi:ABC transporter permease [Rhizohabitans arisaemae]|uniref:ABC transporter permease n=1 Tax=Rhizohabitans arisaemae TaxID=2720610 RepID=UPI0024B0866D|nr:ABC transporter permease [Rhizohabitans arisaemae]